MTFFVTPCWLTPDWLCEKLFKFVAVDCRFGGPHCCAVVLILALILGGVSGTWVRGFLFMELTLDSTGEVWSFS